jgi:hypothetical protein
MNAVHRDEIAKCPNCGANINLRVGRDPGGVNDSGGWVLKCDACASLFSLGVKNPDDASSVRSGATIIDSWDDEINNHGEEGIQLLAISATPCGYYRQFLNELVTAKKLD